MEDVKYICARCSDTGKTCCSLGAGKEGDCFPLSSSETAKIIGFIQTDKDASEHLLSLVPKKIPEDSAEEYWEEVIFSYTENSESFCKSMQLLFPKSKAGVNKAFPRGERHMQLYLPDGEKCIFLSKSGCILPTEARPWFCRIFPFWWQKGGFTCFIGEDCLALKESRNLNNLFKAFSVSSSSLSELYMSLCRDWGIDQ